MPIPLPATTVVVADDHKVIRDGLTLLLERHGEYTVIGDAGDGRTLAHLVLTLQPQVVITDITMPEMNGADALATIREAGYTGIVIVLSMHSDRQSISRVVQAGANAFVHKDHAFQQVLTAIAAARRREFFISPQLAGLMAAGAVPTVTDILSARERSVLQLLAEGKNVKEIAALLNLNYKTIETHRANIFTKLKVGNIVDLTRLAVKEGIAKL